MAILNGMPVGGINFVPPTKETGKEKKQIDAQINQLQAGKFKDILAGKVDDKEITFSKHAQGRLTSRNIKLTNEQMARVEKGISQANTKGIKDSLVVIDNVSLIVNIKNKTVVTAMDNGSTDKDNVFTNIDGAVIV